MNNTLTAMQKQVKSQIDNIKKEKNKIQKEVGKKMKAKAKECAEENAGLRNFYYALAGVKFLRAAEVHSPFSIPFTLHPHVRRRFTLLLVNDIKC